MDDDALRAEAVRIAVAQAAGDWGEVSRNFTDELRATLPPEALHRIWTQTSTLFGRVRRMREPKLERRGPLTVVDVPVRFRRVLFVKRMKIRTTFDADGRVVGVWILSPRHP